MVKDLSVGKIGCGVALGILMVAVILIGGCTLLFGGLIVTGGLLESAAREEPKRTESAPAAEESSVAPAEATSFAPLVVTLDFTRDCWIEAAIDGEDRVSELRVQGESLQLEAQKLVTLTLGNAQGVRIRVNGEDYNMPADQGDVVSDLEIRVEDHH